MIKLENINKTYTGGQKQRVAIARAGYYGSTQYSGENPSFFTQLGINGQLAVGATILEFYKGNPLY